jgi:hypothetical protein
MALIVGVLWYLTHRNETPAAPLGFEPKSLLLAGTAYVELANTRRMIDLNGTFTVEMWVKFAPGEQYLVDDDDWPKLDKSGAPRTLGWVLRVEEDRHMNCTVAHPTKYWISGTGPAIDFDDRWRHIAVSKDSHVLEVFLDGKPYLRWDTTDVRFVNNELLNLFLGPRAGRPVPTTVNCQYKAFRVSDGKLYSGPFTPPEKFTKTDGTLLLLDFAAGTDATVPDVSGNNRHGTISGGHWISP